MNNSIKSTVAQQFGQVAEKYSTSAVHAAGEDLPRLVDALRAQHPQARFCLQAAIAEHPEVLQAMAQAMLQDPSS